MVTMKRKAVRNRKEEIFQCVEYGVEQARQTIEESLLRAYRADRQRSGENRRKSSKALSAAE